MDHKDKPLKQLENYLRVSLFNMAIFISPLFSEKVTRIVVGIGIIISFITFEAIIKKTNELSNIIKELKEESKK